MKKTRWYHQVWQVVPDDPEERPGGHLDHPGGRSSASSRSALVVGLARRRADLRAAAQHPVRAARARCSSSPAASRRPRTRRSRASPAPRCAALAHHPPRLDVHARSRSPSTPRTQDLVFRGVGRPGRRPRRRGPGAAHRQAARGRAQAHRARRLRRADHAACRWATARARSRCASCRVPSRSSRPKLTKQEVAEVNKRLTALGGVQAPRAQGRRPEARAPRPQGHARPLTADDATVAGTTTRTTTGSPCGTRGGASTRARRRVRRRTADARAARSRRRARHRPRPRPGPGRRAPGRWPADAGLRLPRRRRPRGPADEQFDLVTCFATLHHLDLDDGPAAAARRSPPPAVTWSSSGSPRVRTPTDAALSLAAVPAAKVADRVTRATGSTAHRCGTRSTATATCATAARSILPGVRWRRRLYWRYSLGLAGRPPERSAADDRRPGHPVVQSAPVRVPDDRRDDEAQQHGANQRAEEPGRLGRPDAVVRRRVCAGNTRRTRRPTSRCPRVLTDRADEQHVLEREDAEGRQRVAAASGGTPSGRHREERARDRQARDPVDDQRRDPSPERRQRTRARRRAAPAVRRGRCRGPAAGPPSSHELRSR